jgi:hypothetical protein
MLMPLKKSVSLHPRPLATAIEEVVNEVMDIFNPEDGKVSDDPFHQDIGHVEEESMTMIHDYSIMKVTELKDILRQRKLSIKGKKIELIARLEESDTEAADASSVEEQEVPEESAISKGDVSKYERETVGPERVETI